LTANRTVAFGWSATNFGRPLSPTTVKLSPSTLARSPSLTSGAALPATFSSTDWRHAAGVQHLGPDGLVLEFGRQRHGRVEDEAELAGRARRVDAGGVAGHRHEPPTP